MINSNKKRMKSQKWKPNGYIGKNTYFYIKIEKMI